VPTTDIDLHRWSE